MRVKNKITPRYSDGTGGLETKTQRSMPAQKVSSAKKQTDAFQHGTVDAIISMGTSRNTSGRSPRSNKKVNYDLVNSRYKQSDFKHVLNPYGATDTRFNGNGQKMQNFNLVRQGLESLKGEEMKMGLNFRAVAVNGEAVKEKNAKKAEDIKASVMQRIQSEVSGEQVDGQQKTPEQILNYYKTEYANPTEIASNRLLRYLIEKDLLQMKFSKGWEHALISSEEIYYMSIVKGHPSVRVCNPLNVEFDREVESPFIQDADWAMEERWMPVGSVIDLYGSSLTDETVKNLDEGKMGGGPNSNGHYKDFAYSFDSAPRPDDTEGSNTTHVYVANVAWKSFRKIGYLKYLSPRTGMMETTTVDDSFKLTPEMKAEGAELTWEWNTEIWTGTRIGNDTYVDIRPLENQTGSLPYKGYVYNNVNSIATSLVDMVKAHQYTYIIVWWRLEQELAKAKGKKFVMDMAQLPKSKGWTTDQWMYYFDNQGVAWVNSKEEGRKGDPSSTSAFNQFQAIDMSLSNVVAQYIGILNKLEEQVTRMTGVSDQRAGDIGKSETATGAQRAIIQSTNNTKPLFFYHDLVRQGVLNELMELCKIAYADGIELEHAVDEETIETIKIDKGMLNGTQLGVFVTNSFDENMTKEKLEGYLDVALQQDKANLSDVISVLGSKSMSEIRDTIVAGERDKFERDSQAQQSQMESQEKIAAEALADKQADRDLKKYDIDTKADVQLTIAGMNRNGDGDTGMEERKLDLQERAQNHAEQAKDKELDLKQAAQTETERSNKSKEQIAKSKPTGGQNK